MLSVRSVEGRIRQKKRLLCKSNRGTGEANLHSNLKSDVAGVERAGISG